MLPYGLNTYHLKTRHFRGNRLACRVARPGPPGRDPIRPRSSLAHGKSNRPTCLLNPRPGDRAWVIIEPVVARVLRPAVSGEDRPGRLPIGPEQVWGQVFKFTWWRSQGGIGGSLSRKTSSPGLG